MWHFFLLDVGLSFSSKNKSEEMCEISLGICRSSIEPKAPHQHFFSHLIYWIQDYISLSLEEHHLLLPGELKYNKNAMCVKLQSLMKRDEMQH